ASSLALVGSAGSQLACDYGRLPASVSATRLLDRVAAHTIQKTSRTARTHEKSAVCDLVALSAGGGTGSGRPAPGGSRPALHHGVLLPSAVGPPARVSAALLEEPLPAAQEESGERPHAFRKD